METIEEKDKKICEEIATREVNESVTLSHLSEEDKLAVQAEVARILHANQEAMYRLRELYYLAEDVFVYCEGNDVELTNDEQLRVVEYLTSDSDSSQGLEYNIECGIRALRDGDI